MPSNKGTVMVSVVGGTQDGTQVSVFNFFHAELFLESYWWGKRSQEVGGRGSTPNPTLSPPVSFRALGCAAMGAIFMCH